MGSNEPQIWDNPVGSIMTRDVVVADVHATVRSVAKIMEEKGHGCLIVVSGSLAVGIVTERDIVHKVTAEGVDPSKVLVEDIMSTPLITVASTTKIREVAEKMCVYEIRRMVVADEMGKVVGLVTAGDLAKWLAAQKNYTDPALNAIARLKFPSDISPYR